MQAQYASKLILTVQILFKKIISGSPAKAGLEISQWNYIFVQATPTTQFGSHGKYLLRQLLI